MSDSCVPEMKKDTKSPAAMDAAMVIQIPSHVQQSYQEFEKSYATQVLSMRTESSWYGFVFRLHYKYTFRYLLALSFFVIYCSWYTRDVIECNLIDGKNRFFSSVGYECLSNSYMILENGVRQYLVFYGWTQWILLCLALGYYISRWVLKGFENPRIRDLFDELAYVQYKSVKYQDRMAERAAQYITVNMKTNNILFYKYFSCVVLCLIIDIVAFFALDMFLFNRFAGLGFHLYSYDRDIINQTDYISRTFPLFSQCSVDIWDESLTNQKVGTFECWLKAMEFYEKVFFALWFWMVGIMIYALIEIILHCRFIIPRVCHTKSTELNVGDCFLLSKIRRYLNPRSYSLLLELVKRADLRQQASNILFSEPPLNRQSPPALQGKQQEQKYTETHGKGVSNNTQATSAIVTG